MTLRTGRVEEEAGETSGRPEDHFDRGAASTVVSPPLGVTGWARWSWRQLTSMRTALLLLLLLALAAVPGSLFPQRSSDPNGVVQYFKSNPSGAKTIDALQLFNVYTSPWFSAVYILLFISLIGCIVPRTGVYLRALRRRPPRTPRHLRRMPAYASTELPGDAPGSAEILERAARQLRARRYRVARNDDGSVSAERGYLREAGNLVFHISLVLLLVAWPWSG